MRTILLLLVLHLAAVTARAQSGGQITGKLIDSATRQVLPLATVSVFEARDTTLITYRLSNPEGVFRVPNLPTGKALRVVITFSGFAVYRKEFTLDAATPQLDMGTIGLVGDARSLDEVLVVAERPPVSVRKDTIEFNAAAFKTLPTALVEDMLKKLPGVQVDSDGNITVNGKRVNRILVDGKEFFGNDPKMATRNLPANVIDKIQVSADKDEKDLNPDKPEGELGQVINLKLKKGIKKGWFGKAYAGAGTDDRYESGGIVNLFRDTMQVSLLGFTNNLNRAGFGFNDIRSLGGFDRSGINSVWINGNGGINVNGISFGGMGEGINTSTGGGFNLNNVLKSGMTLNSQYFYGQTRNDIRERLNRQQFIGNRVINQVSDRDEVVKTFNHRIGFGLKWKIDSLTRAEFRPGITISNSNSDRLTDITTTDNLQGLLNEGQNRQLGKGRDVQYSHSLLLFRQFKKAGRSLNISHNASYGHTDNDQFNQASNRFYDATPPRDSLLDQLRDRAQRVFNSQLNATWNEPLNKKFSLRIGYLLQFSHDKDRLHTLNKNGNNGKYEVLNPQLSNGLNRESWRNALSTGLNFKHKSLSVTATAFFTTLGLQNHFTRINTQLNQRYTYVLPGVNLNYKQLNISYNANVNAPSIADLQPVPDNSNPLFVVYGNPNLKPAINHNVNLGFFKHITSSSTFINAYLNANFRNNAVVRNRTVGADGVQISTPLNINGIYNLYTNFMYNRQHKLNQKFQVSYGAGYNIDYNRNYLVVNDRRSYVNTYGWRPQANVSLNWNDKIEWNATHSRGYNHTRYESSAFQNLKVHSSRTYSELVIRWPRNLVFETSMEYIYNSQAAPGIQKDVALWNGGVTYLFLKDQKGQLKLTVFDILKQNRSVFRQSTENYIIDRQMNILQQYWLLTFTYNIRNFKAGKVGGRERFFMF